MKLEILPIKKVNPTYTLTINYMIGDTDGHTDKSVSFSELDESLIKLIKILIKLKGYSPKGQWGFIFDRPHLDSAVFDGKITKEERKFLSWDNDEWFEWLCDIIRSTYCDEREFLVYQGFKITYTDENNSIHNVKIIDDEIN